MDADDDVLFFDGVAALRAWAAEHAAAEGSAWVGFARVRYGHPVPSPRYDAVAAELATLGWVGGERRAVGADRYAVRFAPGTVARRKAPAWAEGPRIDPVFSAEYEQRFREHDEAWAFFAKQPPRYRRAGIWWVMSGKTEETRERRIAALIEASASGERVAQLVRQL